MGIRRAMAGEICERVARLVRRSGVRWSLCGNISAIREFVNRVLGQAEAVDVLDRLSELEALLERTAAEATR